MCSSTATIVAPQKQTHAADLWDSPFNWPTAEHQRREGLSFWQAVKTMFK
jgi:hypothetical protein